MRGLYRRGQTWWLVSCRDGRKQYRSLGTKDLRAAIQEAARVRRSPHGGHAPPLEGLLDRYLDDKARHDVFGPRTAERARVAWGRLLRDTGAGCLADLGPGTVSEWFSGLRRSGLKESSCQTYLMAVRSVFSWCVRQNLISENPVAAVRFGHVEKGRKVEWIEAAARDALIAAAEGDMRRVLVLGFLCGLRLGEIVEARRGWIDARAMALHVPGRQALGDVPGDWRTKDRDGRHVPLTRQALALLGKLPANPEAYLVAPDVGHGRWRYRWDPRRPWREFVAAQGLKHLTPHAMRHTFASLLVQRGVSLYKVAQWLGDGPRVVEGHYAHLAPGDRDIEALHEPS